ncbi:MAG TPA: hypothetical protein VLD19_12755, partial [Chitinophagaceae bacterium]|nr:hypothetical protein [Chitinophagaceae bacterium]
MKRISRFLTHPEKFLLLILLLQASLSCLANDSLPPVDVARIKMADTLEKRILYYADASRRLLPEQLPATPFIANIPKNILRQLTPPQVQKNWWLAFRLANSADTTISIYLFPGLYFTSIRLYRYNDSTRQVEAMPDLL